jgi:hypothetical protein
MRTAPLLAALLLVLAPTAARAADLPPHIAVRLAYDNGSRLEGCPDERGLRYALMAQFGYDPTEPSPIADFEAPPILRVTLSRRGAQARAEASLVKASGAVVWSDHYQDRVDCPTLIRNIVLVIRIGIGVDTPPSAAPSPGPTPPEPAQAPVVAEPASRPEPTTAKGPRIQVGVKTGIAFGIAPAAAVGFGLQLGLRWSSLSLSLEGRGDLPAASDALGIRTSLLAATLAPCAHIGPYLAMCGVVTVGEGRSSILAAGSDSSPVRNAYVGVGGRLSLELPFANRWIARLSGDLVGAALPTAVHVNGLERWHTPAVSGGPSLGLVVNFNGP